MEPLHLDLFILDKKKEVQLPLTYILNVLGCELSISETKNIGGIVFCSYYNERDKKTLCCIQIPLWVKSERFLAQGLLGYFKDRAWNEDGNTLQIFHVLHSHHSEYSEMSKELWNGMHIIVSSCLKAGVLLSLTKHDLVNELKDRGHEVITDWMLNSAIARAKEKAGKKAVKKILKGLMYRNEESDDLPF